jgi:hypothetical protein
MNNSVRVPNLKRIAYFLGYYWLEKEIFFFNENGVFEFQINLDRQSQRPIMKICHIPDPLHSHCLILLENKQ